MITRFAPSPTGLLHLGHAFSALTAHDLARAAGGTFLLRIEDIDTARCTAAFEQQIYTDLAWLGLSWPTPVMRQSERQPAYDAALASLAARGLIYACTCTRADIRAALSAPQEGASVAPGVYPGTCRGLGKPFQGAALRLDMRRALELTGPIAFEELGPIHPGAHQYREEDILAAHGDIVLARKDLGTSYHLSVCVDDAAQEVTHVVRGADLFEVTVLHVVLQRLLGLPSPHYLHHRLIRDENGKRLAKRDDARAIALYRQSGLSPQEVRALVGL